MSRRLIVHIGNHKTGTTSIQQSLLASRDLLARSGIALFHRLPDGRAGERGHIHWWFTRPEPGLFDAGRGMRILDPAALLAAVAAERQPTVIVSSEMFSYVFSVEHLHALREAFAAHFGQIQVISYLRRQDRQAVSHFQQASHTPREAPMNYSRLYFGDGFRALPVDAARFDGYLDYHQRLSKWIEVFGAGNLLVRVFEPEQLVGGDAVKDFAAALDLPAPLPSQRLNESLGFARTKVGHVLNSASVSPRMFRLLRNSVADFGRSLPARAEAMAFHARYHASNEALARRIGRGALFNEDFSMYPEQPADLWDEASSALVMRDLFQSMDELYGGLDHRTLRLASCLTFPFNPAAGRRLWRASRFIRARQKGVKP